MRKSVTRVLARMETNKQECTTIISYCLTQLLLYHIKTSVKLFKRHLNTLHFFFYIILKYDTYIHSLEYTFDGNFRNGFETLHTSYFSIIKVEHNKHTPHYPMYKRVVHEKEKSFHSSGTRPIL